MSDLGDQWLPWSPTLKRYDTYPASGDSYDNAQDECEDNNETGEQGVTDWEPRLIRTPEEIKGLHLEIERLSADLGALEQKGGDQ